MYSVDVIRLSLVKSSSWKWINTGPVSVLIKILLIRMSNTNFNALCIDKILIACFDLPAGLSVDWLTSIHLPESPSICVRFWEILSLLLFFFFLFGFCQTISGGRATFQLLLARLNGRLKQILHSNLTYSILSLKKRKKRERERLYVCVCPQIKYSSGEKLKRRERNVLYIYFGLWKSFRGLNLDQAVCVNTCCTRTNKLAARNQVWQAHQGRLKHLHNKQWWRCIQPLINAILTCSETFSFMETKLNHNINT